MIPGYGPQGGGIVSQCLRYSAHCSIISLRFSIRSNRTQAASVHLEPDARLWLLGDGTLDVIGYREKENFYQIVTGVNVGLIA